MIKVWGRATSSNVQTVLWTLAELGQEFERVDVGGSFSGNDTPDYLAMNPHGLIPVLQDGPDVTLWESTAITRYLLATYGNEAIYPNSPAVRAKGDMWADWAKGSFASVLMYKVFWTLVRTPSADRDMAMLADAVEQLKSLLSKVEAVLEQQPWISGANLGYGDLIFGHLLYRYYTLPIDRADLPVLSAYYDKLTARPAYAENVMVSYESLRVE
jgi:glutathione S-transferase